MTLIPRELTDEEYELLKIKLHQAHDKLIKLTLQDAGAMREFTEKIIIPLLKGAKIDLDSLSLDTTTYIRQNLQAFFSDIVYQAMLTDVNKDKPKPVKVSLLIEHKSDMPKQLDVRLQALDYVNAIMRLHYDPETDTTIPVITIIFNQFTKNWKPKTFRSHFPEFSETLAKLLPEFEMLVFELASVSQETLDSLDEYGTLKASLMAMKNVRNKRFLKTHFEKIFVFLQRYPEKTDLRDQLITYLLGQADLSGRQLQELINNIFSPVLKQEIMITGTGFLAVAARQSKAEGRAEGRAEVREEARKEIEKAKKETLKAKQDAEKTKQEAKQNLRLSVLHSWQKGLELDFIASIIAMPHDEVIHLIDTFEKIKIAVYSKNNVNIHELIKISGLSELEVKTLLLSLSKQ
jgi:Putative transposase, YhgA-like